MNQQKISNNYPFKKEDSYGTNAKYEKLIKHYLDGDICLEEMA